VWKLKVQALYAIDANLTHWLISTQTITKVRSFAGARHHICVFVRHVVARLGIILFDNLKTPGAALRAMRLPPFFYLDVGPLGTLYIGMPGALAPNAPSIGAIRTLHHGVAVSRQINE